MATPKGNNQLSEYKGLNDRLEKIVQSVRTLYDELNKEVALYVSKVGYNGEKEFHWKDYPQLKKKVLETQKKLSQNLKAIVMSGTAEEWKNSNIAQDLLADKSLSVYKANHNGEEYDIYYQTNPDALKAFQNRQISSGGTLSQNVWNQSLNYRKELEYAISTAIIKGTDARTLSKQISKYLVDFDKLSKDYTEKYGKAVKCKDCEYRSIRLARSEINMAYRTAEQTRWEQMDFVVGYEIKLSHQHHHRMPKGDICDTLAGKYPKSFKWNGWHPNDMCYLVPILKSEEEFWADEDVKSEKEVTDVPTQFKQWVADNTERINKAKERGTLPYFIKDNRVRVNDILKNSALIKSPQPFILDKQGYEQMLSNGFSEITRGVEGYNKSAIAGFNIIEFDNFLSRILNTEGVKISNKSISVFSTGNATMFYKGKLGNKHFELSRSFIRSKDGVKVHHDLLILPEVLQGKGYSKKIMAEMFKSYDNMGVVKVEVMANIDVGGYCWGKYGFSANKEEVMEIVYDQRFRKKVINKDEFNSIIKILDSSGDEVKMNKLANMSYGKKLLMGSSWSGFIDMKDLVQKKYLYDYLGLTK